MVLFHLIKYLGPVLHVGMGAVLKAEMQNNFFLKKIEDEKIERKIIPCH